MMMPNPQRTPVAGVDAYLVGRGYCYELRPAMRIAEDRCRPLMSAWALRAAGFGANLDDLMSSCYLQGVSDALAARIVREKEADHAE